MKRVIAMLVGGVVLGCGPGRDERAEAETQSAVDVVCTADGGLVAIPEAPEASNVAASGRTPGTLWTSNDEGTPVLLAVDEKGRVTGKVTLAGAERGDWEALAVAKCSAGSCLYVADIGDNDAKREAVTVYRVAEPLPADSVTADPQVFHATYPDGPHDAEAIWVTERREVFVVTKGEQGAIAVYQYPPESAQNGKTVELKRVAQLDDDPSRREMITDASISPDGKWVVLRSNKHLFFYRPDALRSGKPGTPRVYDLSDLKEPQGEGVAFGNDGVLYLTGEGGGKGRPGTLARLRCTLEG